MFETDLTDFSQVDVNIPTPEIKVTKIQLRVVRLRLEPPSPGAAATIRMAAKRGKMQLLLQGAVSARSWCDFRPQHDNCAHARNIVGAQVKLEILAHPKHIIIYISCVVPFGSFDRSAVNLSNLKIILNY